MATDYKALIRIRQWDLDEQRRQLGQLNAAYTRIEQEIAKLQADYEREQAALAETDFIAAGTFGNYTEGMIKRRNSLQQALKSLDQQIAEKTEEVREAFQEVKKFELAQEELEAAEDARLQRLENIELDDIAVDAHSRRQKAGD
ncbi:MAG TPA: hypothetical protein DFI00_08790 [Rhodospirillaceae bacterium]|nr:hypothetical protein [Alphaproteobacteria bacterium]OUT39665.1 MAG: hypothetical protein CBB62_15005 [Micavibrio sp. TMED2]HCI47378.1 hypothetical protein [Rhodospirillaceae bacterium]MAS49061.1 hypothetical protein [Alphaproteobacteria bacterium]MAX97337.1 hypothetical protein [Alphaproteobacteria bacterium]|tara:strand:- start:2929 stop:3360 length:432 start_codon:yes stop_codon:yes gene_type:complete